VILGLELRASHLPGRHSTTQVILPPLFCVGYFQDGVSGTISLGWPQIEILLISTSRVPRIADVSHWCLALEILKILKLFKISWIKDGIEMNN
jgi:hypothetical protein